MMKTVGSPDTAPDARRVQIEVLRRMAPEERVRVAVAMSEEAREITSAGICASHPGWTEERVLRELLTRIYGADLVERAWGPPVEE